VAKSPDAFRTISEVALQLDTPAHVLRFWESKFSQIKPVKRAGGRRYYRPDDIALLGGIKVLLHDQGMTIRGVQKLLRERGPRHVATLSALPWEGVDSLDEPQEEAAELEDAAAPESVVVGPWPGAGEAGADGTEMATPVEAREEDRTLRPAASIVGDFVAGVAARRSASEARVDAHPSVAHLREALSRVDRARLRAEAARLQPLIRRLRDLQGAGAGRPA
jgi:DNA-binding transcriptional MerR regulator